MRVFPVWRFNNKNQGYKYESYKSRFRINHNAGAHLFR